MNNNIFGDGSFDDGLDTGEELKFRKPNHFKRKKKLLIILIILLSAGLVFALCFGAYKLFFDKNEEFDDSVAYYFYSDLLNEEGGDYSVIGSIDFNLYNFADSLRTSKETITDFDITVRSGGEDISGDVEISVGERTMEAGIRSTCAVSIDVPDEYLRKPVNVSVTSKPIEITLKGSFTVTPEWSYDVIDASEDSYSVTENGVEVKVLLSTEKKITLDVEWDSEKLIPNISDEELISSLKNNGTLSIALDANSSVTLSFFKTDISESFDKDSEAVKVRESDKDISSKKGKTADKEAKE